MIEAVETTTTSGSTRGRLAQLVEQRSRKAKVVGSKPTLASTLRKAPYLYTDAIGGRTCRATIAHPRP